MTAPLECAPYGVAAMLLARLQEQLALTRAGVPDRMAVYPHAAPAIEFCSMAWVGLRSVRPDAQIGRDQHCGVASWAVELTAGVARCYPVKQDGSAPSPVEVDSAARDVLDDFEAMRRAVDGLRSADVLPVIGRWSPMPVQGGSHGSTLEVIVSAGLGAFSDEVLARLPGDPRG